MYYCQAWSNNEGAGRKVTRGEPRTQLSEDARDGVASCRRSMSMMWVGIMACTSAPQRQRAVRTNYNGREWRVMMLIAEQGGDTAGR